MDRTSFKIMYQVLLVKYVAKRHKNGKYIFSLFVFLILLYKIKFVSNCEYRKAYRHGRLI